MRSVAPAETQHWPMFKKIGLKFFFVFFLLFSLFIPDDIMPFYGKTIEPLLHLFQSLISWFAKYFIHVEKPLTVDGLGSDDTTFNYLLFGFFILIAALTTAIWSYTGRSTTHYNKLYYWFFVMLRYFLALTMIVFGFYKLFRLQFPELTGVRLVERLGDMSPMRLIWVYMSYSSWFNYLAGFSELLCGVLLFFRKTTRLGAILGVVLFANITAINFCFDVCLKLSSATMLVMCLFILMPDYAWFLNFFFDKNIALPAKITPHRFSEKWKNMTLSFLKYGIIFYIFFWTLRLMMDTRAQYGPGAPKLPLSGVYEVESFVRNRDTLLPLTTDKFRWSKFWITTPGAATVKLMNDSLKIYSFKPDTANRIIVAGLLTDTVNTFKLHYIVQKPEEVILSGQWFGDSVTIKMRCINRNSFRLIKRGFHWINESPYVR